MWKIVCIGGRNPSKEIYYRRRPKTKTPNIKDQPEGSKEQDWGTGLHIFDFIIYLFFCFDFVHYLNGNIHMLILIIQIVHVPSSVLTVVLLQILKINWRKIDVLNTNYSKEQGRIGRIIYRLNEFKWIYLCFKFKN